MAQHFTSVFATVYLKWQISKQDKTELKSNVNFFNQSKSQETFVYSYACNIFFLPYVGPTNPNKAEKKNK